jgi:1-acyl-sn-glycerol-3-phosphate acyltransferase
VEPGLSSPRWHELFRRVAGGCRLAVFALLFLALTVIAPFIPGLERRRRLVSAFSRAGLRTLRLAVRTEGFDHLPGDSCVLVANHGSYLDGAILQAVLPPRFAFVIKREAESWPLVGWLLRLIDAEFLARHENGSRHKDARRLMRRAAAGRSLVFFPEGTFTAQSGVRRFHSGAFATALRAGCPIVPTVIHGARRALPNDRLLPRRGSIVVEILAPLATQGRSPDELRDEARRLILERLDEPDLLAVARPPAPGR